MEVRITLKDNAFDNKGAFEEAIKDFTKQAIMAKMEMNYHKYERDDAFCANVLMIQDINNNGFIPAKMEEELETLNRHMNLDWIDNV